MAAMAASLGAQAAIATAKQQRHAGAARQAHASRTLRVSDRGDLRYHSVAATSIFDQGPLSGTIPGQAHVDFLYDGSPTVSASFTIYASGGSIHGSARCRLHNPTSLTPSFRGALQITGGSGRYSRAGGSGELFGVFHRRGYALEIQATGELRY
jgi:hypothetical protein